MNAPLIPEMNALREWEELSGRERQVLQRALSIGNQQLKLFYLKIGEPCAWFHLATVLGFLPKKTRTATPWPARAGNPSDVRYRLCEPCGSVDLSHKQAPGK